MENSIRYIDSDMRKKFDSQNDMESFVNDCNTGFPFANDQHSLCVIEVHPETGEMLLGFYNGIKSDYYMIKFIKTAYEIAQKYSLTINNMSKF